MDEYYIAHIGEDKYMDDPNAQVTDIKAINEGVV
jgi:hypothetical protein